MSGSSRAWIVAASVGVVEALKDQGICRWNYTIRSLHQHAQNQLRSRSQSKKIFSSQSSAMISSVSTKGVPEESEESLRKIMFLSSWGPH